MAVTGWVNEWVFFSFLWLSIPSPRNGDHRVQITRFLGDSTKFDAGVWRAHRFGSSRFSSDWGSHLPQKTFQQSSVPLLKSVNCTQTPEARVVYPVWMFWPPEKQPYTRVTRKPMLPENIIMWKKRKVCDKNPHEKQLLSSTCCTAV